MDLGADQSFEEIQKRTQDMRLEREAERKSERDTERARMATGRSYEVAKDETNARCLLVSEYLGTFRDIWRAQSTDMGLVAQLEALRGMPENAVRTINLARTRDKMPIYIEVGPFMF
jgi:hypothetical protein